ncbi:ubiquitin [Clostridium oryzae]|uniref:UBA/TS-N domain protein n=1 Tax=Clostridium oryzae TaxID=1450648 RepID=A0A1V4IX00_9CLOT|nr:ubiquitin [Clostridium oryzae]OPJ64413.1 hypothetical protein CLORY_06070 [Clostridium oryzae]
MENHKLVEKLQKETNINYKEASDALEKANGNLLDAMLYLEEKGKVKKPSVSVFYTNEYKENYKYREIIIKKDHENNYNNSKRRTNSGGVFEAVCKVIDICNNIFFEIKRENSILLRLPITVVIVLLMFVFWIVIPLFIVGLFFDMEFSLSGKREVTNKINNIFKLFSVNVKKVKEGLRKGFKND